MRLIACTLLLGLGAAGHPHHAAPRMAETAQRLIASLTDEQRAKAVLPFDGDERFYMHYVPDNNYVSEYKKPRAGITIKELTPTQQHLASALLSAGLSQQGYIKTTTIMSLEEILKLLERDTVGRRDPERYYFSIFGTPADKGVWGYRVEGHHVSLHYTVVDGKAVGNPMFLGSNPAEVRDGPRKGLRVLGAEEDKGRALMTALTAEQRKVAIVDAKAYSDILTTTKRKAALEGKPSGLPASKMTPAQRKLLDELIEEYIDNLPSELAEQRRDRVKKSGQNIWFAWAGVVEKGGPHYYRVQSSTFLIEYDNTQNNANHIHSVWRDFDGDWGLDVLKQHYETSPASHGHTTSK